METNTRYITHVCTSNSLPGVGHYAIVGCYTVQSAYLGKGKYHYETGLHSFDNRSIKTMEEKNMIVAVPTSKEFDPKKRLVVDYKGNIYSAKIENGIAQEHTLELLYSASELNIVVPEAIAA